MVHEGRADGGVGIYKDTEGVVTEVFCDTLPESSGIVAYSFARYEGEDYIAYLSGGSFEYMTLSTLNGGKLEKVKESLFILLEKYLRT